jgi:hypothetical protein
MLTRTRDIYQGNQSLQDEPARDVTGQYLAKNRLNARARARLAASIADERVKIRKLTIGQAARLCRVCKPYVTAARRPPTAPETLAEHFARSTPDERLACARTIGTAVIWDSMINPLV